MKSVYLDNNATTYLAPEVAQAMAECYAQRYANPASQHAEGRRARKVLEQARRGIAEILGARIAEFAADRVIFTSGGTESNNLLLRGLVTPELPAATRLIVSSVEHPSVTETALHLSQCGCELQHLPVDVQGVVCLDALQALLSPDTRCVSIMLANHETGVLQPVRQAARLAAARGIVFHTDATQAVGKIPVDFSDLQVDALTATAHKFHGPKGIGVLILRHDLNIQPIFTGGSQQLGTRPGTESVSLAVGMWRALELWQQDASVVHQRMQSLRDRLEKGLLQNLPKIVVHGAQADRIPQTLNISFLGVERQALLLALDRGGVACATGSACSSGSSEPSPVLKAMGCAEPLIESSLRLTLSRYTTAEEIDFVIQKIVEIYRRISASNAP